MAKLSKRRFLNKGKVLRTLCSLLLLATILSTGCTQEMANQRRIEPQEVATAKHGYFAPEHTIPASPLALGGGTRQRFQSELERPEVLATSATGGPLTMERLQRGRERFNIWCAPCHDRTGSGDGMVARRGFRYPPSYHIERLREQPIAYFYEVASQGKGEMPAYQNLISDGDRWAIAAYVRALQLSQRVPIDELSYRDRGQLP